MWCGVVIAEDPAKNGFRARRGDWGWADFRSDIGGVHEGLVVSLFFKKMEDTEELPSEGCGAGGGVERGWRVGVVSTGLVGERLFCTARKLLTCTPPTLGSWG